ncbi:uncharacterized protein NEMAJ01_0164 [Nematocida major]|uniref:uncharacterized protein n=1 Tax=Nematocida major TaxID=1912982 RepID=UPI002007812F|nr:uncharacterized protein NEMAJ01_0164 [Nematocida major]KAH9385268.1 hypothetical protein NEMAJ01_0164 [Nematocida major]
MDESNRKNLPSEKRRQKFQELFKSIPKQETLVYSCPCILKDNSKYCQGRMYISNEHISFYSKSIFGNATLIVKLKSVIAIEIKTAMLLSGSLEVITYDKTYSFKTVFYKEKAYPIALLHWQRAMGLGSNVKSIFQVDIPRPSEVVEERAISEEERVFDIDLRRLLRRIVHTPSTLKFYRTLTDDEITIKTYMNRRTIQFANEFIDEIYTFKKNKMCIEYHSKGTLCKIFIAAKEKNSTKVKIVEKYNYTTQHYFNFISELAAQEPDSVSCFSFVSAIIIALCIKIGRAAYGVWGR